MGIGFIGGLGITASLTVAATVVASITLLPALLGFAGTNIERTKWRGLDRGRLRGARAGRRRARDPALIGGRAGPRRASRSSLGFFVPALKREVPHRPPKPRRETVAYRWSRVIQHRPWPFAIGAAAVLLVLAIPVLSLRLGFSDESNFADDTTTKQAYDLIVEGFGKGSTGPVYLVAEVDGAGPDRSALAAVNDAGGGRPAAWPRCSARSPTTPTSPTAVRWLVTPASGPAGRSDHGPGEPAARRRAAPDRGRGGRRCARHRSRGRQRRHVASTWRSGCRSSSAPCSRCRSCC